MPLNTAKTRILGLGLMVCLVSSCFHPPYNNFRPDPRTERKVAAGAVVGTVTGAIISGTASGALIGTGVGGAVGLAVGMSKDSKSHLIKQLQKQDIVFIEYGDTISLIVPVDKYFVFNSARLNEVCYPGLNNIVRLIKRYPPNPVYIAGFTDNVGSTYNKNMMSQAQAETMLSFLWANGIHSARLKAEGYGEKFAVSDNALIHGSAQNRRIEIQWFTGLIAQAPSPVFFTK